MIPKWKDDILDNGTMVNTPHGKGVVKAYYPVEDVYVVVFDDDGGIEYVERTKVKKR